jgi:RES domain-containing protein
LTFSAWRITKEVHARSAFSGEGARLYGGRWNSRGTALIYTAQSQSLAVLEMLVHLDSPELLKHFVLFEVTMPSSVVEVLDVAKLPHRWKENPIPDEVQSVGDDWVRSRRSAVLRVPSTLVPAECNFLLNPAHPEFRKLHMGKAVPFAFDARLARQS